MESLSTKELIDLALAEDLPQGDVTTDSLAIESRPGVARLLAKEDLILSGSEIFQEVVHRLDPEVRFSWYFKDGQLALKGQHLCMIQGDLMKLLRAERVALNFLGHLSGIATLTRCFVDQIKHTKTRILDTRKTTPLYRDLEKKAVRDGGGTNHRKNLSDAIMIKDNHIRASGGMTAAVKRIRQKSSLPITVEAATLEEVAEAVELKIGRILLDNMNNDLLKQALEVIPPSIETEASGNMRLERVKSVAELGVHFISVGLITHSAPVADISLEFEWSRS